MAVGWAKDGAEQEQIEATVNDALEIARRNLPQGQESAEFCEECGEPIPEARRKALPGVQYCVSCQEKLEKSKHKTMLYNRRGSKDSQLR